MLNGVHLSGIHDRLLVGAGEAQIKGSDDRAAHRILAGYVDAGLKQQVIDGETCDFFHNIINSFRNVVKFVI